MHLQPVLMAMEGASGPAPAAFQNLIEFIAEYGAVTQACIVGISAERLDADRILAQVGERFEIDASDPVLSAALESGELATVNFASGQFGRITTQAGAPRIMQFGVKYAF